MVGLRYSASHLGLRMIRRTPHGGGSGAGSGAAGWPTGREQGMRPRRMLRGTTVLAVTAVLAGVLSAPSFAGQSSDDASGRYLLVAKSGADLSALRAKALRQGAKVVHAMPQLKALAIQGSEGVRRSLAADGRTLGVARDQLRRITPEPRVPNLDSPGLRGASRLKAKAPAASRGAGINPGPGGGQKGRGGGFRAQGPPPGGARDRRQPQGDRRRGRHRAR